MQYFNVKRRKKLPNRNLDKFLAQLQMLCKRHRIMTIPEDARGLVAEEYDESKFRKFLNTIQDNTTPEIVEEVKDDKKPDLG